MGYDVIKDKDGVERYYGNFCFNRKRHNGFPLERWNNGKQPATRKEAQGALERFREAVRNGEPLDGGAALDGHMAFSDFIEYYKTHYVAERRKVGKMRGNMDDSMFTQLGRDPIAKMSLLDLQKPAPFVQLLGRLRSAPITMTFTKKTGVTKTVTLKRKKRPATIDKFITRLKHMMAFAKASDFIEKNPFEHDPTGLLKKRRAAQGRKRRISAAEEKALRAHILDDSLMEARIDVALTTGMRRAELQGLQFKHLDIAASKIHIDGTVVQTDDEGYEEEVGHTKSGKSRAIPLNKATLAIFAARRDAIVTFVFGKSVAFKPADREAQLRDLYIFGDDFGHHVTSFKKAWNSLKDRAGLDDATLKAAGKMSLHWHDLRGEACTRMLERPGANPVAVMNIMGHSDLKITLGHYQGEMEAAMRQAVGE